MVTGSNIVNILLWVNDEIKNLKLYDVTYKIKIKIKDKLKSAALLLPHPAAFYLCPYLQVYC